MVEARRIFTASKRPLGEGHEGKPKDAKTYQEAQQEARQFIKDGAKFAYVQKWAGCMVEKEYTLEQNPYGVTLSKRSAKKHGAEAIKGEIIGRFDTYQEAKAAALAYMDKEPLRVLFAQTWTNKGEFASEYPIKKPRTEPTKRQLKEERRRENKIENYKRQGAPEGLAEV